MLAGDENSRALGESSESGGSMDMLCDLLQCVIMQILHDRNVYPAACFERRRLFGVAAYRCRSSELSDYVATVVQACRRLIAQAECDALVVTILGDAAPTQQKSVLERFRLDIRHGGDAAVVDAEALRGLFGGLLVKAHTMCDTLLDPLPSDKELSFQIELHAHATTSLPTTGGPGGFQVCATDPSSWQRAGQEPRIVPIAAMDAGGVALGVSVLRGVESSVS